MPPSLWFLFSTSFVVGMSGAMMPGPVLTATVSESLKHGQRAGPLIVVGHGVLEVILVVGLCLGLAPFLVQDRVVGTLGLVGGALLVILGLAQFVTARGAAKEAAVPAEEREGAPPIHGPVLAGSLTTLSNPYWYLWWATIGLSYTAESLRVGVAGVVSFYTGHILSDLAWFGFVAFLVATGRNFLSPRVMRWVYVACGLALVGLGVVFVRMGMARFGMVDLNA